MNTSASSGAVHQASTTTTTTTNTSAKPADPFADLGNLTAGLSSGWLPTSTATSANNGHTTGSSKPTGANPVTSPLGTRFSSPTHQFATPTPSPRPPSTPNHPPTRSPANERAADYSRSHFLDGAAKNGVSKTGTAAAPGTATAAAAAATGGLGGLGGLGGDIFGDILGQQGYNFASKSTFNPRSINEMRKEEMVRDMDPDKLKLLEWVSVSLSQGRIQCCCANI